MPSAGQAALLFGAGLAGGIAHILMTLSFRHAEAAALAPFEYLSILWAAAAGALFFAEVPDWAFLVAAPLILRLAGGPAEATGAAGLTAPEAGSRQV
jgi:drug/metabolite transporter (DMT)-like permease